MRSDLPLNFAPHISRVPVSKLHPSSTNTRLSIVVFWHIALDEKCWINMFRQRGQNKCLPAVLRIHGDFDDTTRVNKEGMIVD